MIAPYSSELHVEYRHSCEVPTTKGAAASLVSVVELHETGVPLCAARCSTPGPERSTLLDAHHEGTHQHDEPQRTNHSLNLTSHCGMPC